MNVYNGTRKMMLFYCILKVFPLQKNKKVIIGIDCYWQGQPMRDSSPMVPIFKHIPLVLCVVNDLWIGSGYGTELSLIHILSFILISDVEVQLLLRVSKSSKGWRGAH